MKDVLTATQLLIQLLTQAQTISNLIAAAQARGTDITKDELNTLRAADDAARAALQAFIDGDA